MNEVDNCFFFISFIVLVFLFRLAQQSIKALPSEIMEKVTVKSALWSKDEDQLLADLSQVMLLKNRKLNETIFYKNVLN